MFYYSEVPPGEERQEVLISGREAYIERIVSCGYASPKNFWYDQKIDEWVAVIQGKAVVSWDNGKKKELSAGDWVFILAGERHRVEWTSSDPPCVWLAVHAKLMKNGK